jgi:beta-aspartyl-peptidase (threonine type)
MISLSPARLPRRSPALRLFLLMLALASSSAASAEDAKKFAIVIHGGAGDPASLTEDDKRHHDESLRKALEVGRKILAEDGAALDAVEQVIRTLEDDPFYNAGKGAVFNREGKHELDASIMDGKSKQAGAVAGVSTVKNPISLARLVMTQTRHVLLAGEGAERFADEMRDRPQIERVKNDYFDTDAARQEWQEALQKESARKPVSPHMGTVGCVVLDRHGNLAAGTSTGGLTNKKWGRVGDSPIVGAGTYADNATCGVSCTGTGEYFIRASAAFHVAALMQYKQQSVEEGVRDVIDRVLPANTGGMIALDRHGRIATRCNTPGMVRAWIDAEGKFEVRLGK